MPRPMYFKELYLVRDVSSVSKKNLYTLLSHTILGTTSLLNIRSFVQPNVIIIVQ